MTRLTVTIQKEADRQRAHDLVSTSPIGSRLEFKAAKRSLPQNDRLWAMLSDVAEQLDWHGVKLNTEEWKWLFLDALKREVRVIPNLEGNGFVNIGRSSSDLSKEEFSDLLELIAEFGARHSVTFHDDEPESTNLSGNSPVAPRTDDAPAASGPHAVVAAGVREEASLLSDDWRDVMVQNLAGHRDRPASLAHRRNDGLQMIGGAPNALEEAWIDRLSELVARRNRGQLKPGEYETELAQLKAMPLTAAKVAA